MILLVQQNDVVLLEDVAETLSACDCSDCSGSGMFIPSVSDISPFSIMSCTSYVRIHFNDVYV